MPDTLEQNLLNRKRLLDALAGEVFGPGSHLALDDETKRLPRKGKAYTIVPGMSFSSWKAYADFCAEPRYDETTGEEILIGETPLQRYGTGVLFPSSVEDENEEILFQQATVGMCSDDEGEDSPEGAVSTTHEREEQDRGVNGETSEHDVYLSTLKKPRSIGVSFVVNDQKVPLQAVIKGGFYVATPVLIKNDEEKNDAERVLWTRKSFERTIDIDLAASPIKLLKGGENAPELELSVHLRGRYALPAGEDYPAAAALVTVCLVNRGDVLSYRQSTAANRECFFQAQLTVRPKSGAPPFLPYPEPSVIKTDPEVESLNLLYRNAKTFATGHGAAGTWETVAGREVPSWVKSEALPLCQTPGVTSKVEFDGKKVEISLASLSDFSKSDGMHQLGQLVTLYEKWIDEKKVHANDPTKVDKTHTATALRHISEMEVALNRMKKGLALLKSNDDAKQLFEWTNRAMHLQSVVPRGVREPIDLTKPWNFNDSYDPEEMLDTKELRKWRPFQIAFLLMNLPSLHSVKSSDREIVDLIWFPTGGGKTEAYLACAAYSMFRRRQLNPNDIGTEVIMRYTLRLLTAQQFERASALICAMNVVREDRETSLGSISFTIGIWVGGSTTPNSFNNIQKKPEDYNLVLRKCPWCAARMGPRKTGRSWTLEGYTNKVFHCTDQECRFHEKLPLHVVDEHLYDTPPTYLIATVDKFAMLAWNKRPRRFFGIGRDGKQFGNPPGLIIQDELHLITGPLGSMVGLYEAVIEELCTTRADGSKTLPKLIAATATTRASAKQISDLYARPRSGVFPPPGLDASDSFFARHDIDEDGKLRPAREYLGFLGLNYSSALTSSVRLTSALHCAAWMLPEDERDPWWTLLYFYNAIRELGGGLSLYDADIKERMKNVQSRWIGKYDRDKKNFRWINQSRELTGRLQNSEIPERLKELEKPYSPDDSKALDACLASNIIEVGVDVDRLSLMAVQGQPKTTAQYIQATGRIGRNLRRPGLVIVNYGAQKGRDRSHYEQFQAYHDRLYAAVEPSSVTPFTLPVMKRALHSIMAAWIRQSSKYEDSSNSGCDDIPKLLRSKKQGFLELLSGRISRLSLSSEEKAKLLEDVDRLLIKSLNTAEGASPGRWHSHEIDAEQIRPLQVQYGIEVPHEWNPDKVWHSPTSMRSVDSECPLHIRNRITLTE